MDPPSKGEATPSASWALRCFPRNVVVKLPTLEVVFSVPLTVRHSTATLAKLEPRPRKLEVFITASKPLLPYGYSREGYILVAPPYLST